MMAPFLGFGGAWPGWPPGSASPKANEIAESEWSLLSICYEWFALHVSLMVCCQLYVVNGLSSVCHSMAESPASLDRTNSLERTAGFSEVR